MLERVLLAKRSRFSCVFFVRLTEVSCNKVSPGPHDETTLDHLVPSQNKLYRIEEVPKDEVEIEEDEMLISCAHFQKETFATFGFPFLLKIKHGEPFVKVKGMKKKLFRGNLSNERVM